MEKPINDEADEEDQASGEVKITARLSEFRHIIIRLQALDVALVHGQDCVTSATPGF
jgi:hypothetical protein